MQTVSHILTTQQMVFEHLNLDGIKVQVLLERLQR